MPQNLIKKTASAPKYFKDLVLLVLVVSVFVSSALIPRPQLVTLKQGNQTLFLEKAITRSAQEHGLSDRSSLAQNHGMLFVFDKTAIQCFWMKDMRFPLDIIWLNEDKTIIHVEQNVSPATYPNSFCPKQPAKYVMELNSGMAKKLNLKAGQPCNL